MSRQIEASSSVARHAAIDRGHTQASDRLNSLRAAVLGANDGIVSTAGLVLGVAGATAQTSTLVTAGVAGLVAGALSMASGEYVSVSAQRDSEMAAVRQEQHELAAMPEQEFKELVGLLEQRGLSPATALHAAREMSSNDALAAHAEVELGIRLGRYTSPWQAALSSAGSFAVGALVPLLAIGLAPASNRVAITAGAALVALVLTGAASARLGRSPQLPAVIRNVVGASIAMAVTFAIGRLVGIQIGG